ncbi:MAG: hypothetical protein RBT66_04105 [bacterium]|jgi:hypothetical protein|nr:hypothetical protein [Sphaerochaetaceae bacterium]MDX9780205.1 hypothetical protein [bacterium]
MKNLYEVLDDLEIQYKNPGEHHHTSASYIQIDCPFCSKNSESYRMGIHMSGSHANCWRCGPHNILDTLREITGLSFPEIKELMQDLVRAPVYAKRVTGKITVPKGIQPLKELPRHRHYLKNRGYDWKELQRLWKIQGIPFASKLAWRLFIPILYRGEMVSWTSRTISKNPDITRYISAKPSEETIHHKSLLYGEDYARHAIVIVEGPFDVWRIGPGAVATLGTGFSQGQVVRMTEFPIRAVVFDAEPEAQKRARKLRDTLAGFPGETYLIELESGKDAGEASEKEIRQIRKEILK